MGAGPGDPRLITLRGVECLAQADLILYDWLVNPIVLGHANPSAESICLGHHGEQGTQRLVAQDEINARLIAAAREGKTVVRLKCGDPDVFGRRAEEAEALIAAGIEVEVVPGVTAALAAAGYAGIPLTDGRCCSAIALVTGHERHTKQGPPLDYAALATFPGTLIFYMGVSTAPQWSELLIAAGKSPQTPVALVRRCSWFDQRTVRCTLGTIAQVIGQQAIRPPAVIIVGEVVSLAAETSWFTSRVLFGTRVLVTRPRDQAGRLCEQLSELGADVLVQPAIEISDPPDWGPVDASLARLDQYDWLVFSSVNGVRYLLDRLCQRGDDLRRLGRIKLAAIGSATAEELLRYHLRGSGSVGVPSRGPGRRIGCGRRGPTVPAGPGEPRPRDPGRTTARGRRGGGSSRGLCERRRAYGRPGDCGGTSSRPDRLDHGDQLGDCPLAGRAVRRATPEW